MAATDVLPESANRFMKMADQLYDAF